MSAYLPLCGGLVHCLVHISSQASPAPVACPPCAIHLIPQPCLPIMSPLRFSSAHPPAPLSVVQHCSFSIHDLCTLAALAVVV